MSRVQNALQFVVDAEKRVGFVDEQTRLVLLDHPEHCGWGNVRGQQRAQHQARQHIEQRGLTAAFGWRADAQPG